MWGLAANLTDMLLAAFKKIMSMNDFQTTWIQMAYYGSYLFLSFPAALLIRKFNYKTGILVGLGMYIIGALLFYPASQTMVYGHFLVALFILAGGIAILETTANPYALVMGPESSAIQRLNLAQSFNPIGALTGVVIGKLLIFSELNKANELERAALSSVDLISMQKVEMYAVMTPYIGIAILLLLIWLVIASRKMPMGADISEVPILDSVKRLLHNKVYVSGVVAQFLNVGGMTCIYSFMVRYIMVELGTDESGAANYQIAALILFTASRFVFTALLSRYSAYFLLGLGSLVAVLCLGAVITTSGLVSVVALILISASMSLTFPTIFGLACQGTGSDQKIAGSGLIMAISGGAALPAIQGLVSDATHSIKFSYIVPLLCCAGVFLYAVTANRLKKSRDKATIISDPIHGLN